MKNKTTPTVTLTLEAAHALSQVLARQEWGGKIVHGSILWQGINKALKAFEPIRERTHVRKN